MKKPSISTVVIFIIILLAVGGLIFLNKPKQTEAPTDGASEVQNTETSTTTNPNTPVNTTTNPNTPVSSENPTLAPGTQVIYGDGIVTTITQTGGPTGEAPIIEKFALDNPGSSVCRFSWDVRKAKTCNIINVTTKMQVSAVDDEGVIQTSERGDYQLKCAGDGGKVSVSEVVSCK